MSLDIKITDAARDKIKKIIADNNLGDQSLRLAVRGGGCSGFSYDLTFTGTINKDDKTDTVNDVKIVVDQKSYLYLKGITLDYHEDLISGGFRFINPNAKNTCGCGTSFST